MPKYTYQQATHIAHKRARRMLLTMQAQAGHNSLFKNVRKYHARVVRRFYRNHKAALLA